MDDHVLKAAGGAGASAIPSARDVGPAGRVLGVDLAEPLLAVRAARQAAAGLSRRQPQPAG